MPGACRSYICMRPALSEFEAVYRRSYARYFRVASAITRQPESAAEAVQEAFARTIQRRRQFRGEGSLDVWIWRAVVNEAKRLAAPAPSPPPAGAAAANGAASDEASVRALIAALPERQRTAVFLRYYADLDYRTIGEVLEIETGTVSATLAAAHKSLRDAIEGVRS
jgi:RNA polymerase sigma-70 factor (ECF subfamily)